MGHLTPWIKNQRAIRGFEWAIERQHILVGHKHNPRHTLDKKREAKCTKRESFTRKKTKTNTLNGQKQMAVLKNA